MFQFLMRPDCAALVLRLMLGSIFIAQGSLKVIHFEGGTTWYDGADVLLSKPAVQAAVAWGELLCGAAVTLGLLTRLASLGLIVIMIGAIYKVTWKLEFTRLVGDAPRGFFVHEVGYEYNYAIIAMCASVIILGAGVASLDWLLWRRPAAAAAPPRAN